MNKVTISKMPKEEFLSKGIKMWPIWGKEVSRFDWFYDSNEECFILEGEVIIETEDLNYTIKASDFVIFQKGLRCIWEIKEPIKKHYNFN